VETFSHGTLSPDWVTGFTEGVGSFTYSRSGKQIAVYFALKLPLVDRPFLESIQQFFGGIGRLYDVKTTTKGAVYYRVTNRSELPTIVEHFDQHPLQTSKARVYEVWRLMVLAKQQFRNTDKAEMNALADRLSRIGRSEN
jgi:hypothetical protein